MANFESGLALVLKHEGGYTNDADDPGGETNYGITVAEARAAGYVGAMRDLPMDLVRLLYRERYWDVIRGDEIPDQAIAEKIFDAGVNVGIHRPVEWLQRGMNAMNGKGLRWPDVAADGKMGPGTLAALSTCLAAAPYYRDNLLKIINGFQAVRYVELAERNVALESFVAGWIRARVEGK